MSDQTGDPTTQRPSEATPTAPPRTAWQGPAPLEVFVETNRERFTPEALEAAAIAAGHDAEAIRDAIRRVEARRVAAPTNAQARSIVYLAYGLTYAFLVAALLGSGIPYGVGPIAAVVLTVVLGVAFAIARYWVVRRGAPLGLGALLSLPLVLLVLVGGACYFTTLSRPV